MGTIVRVKRRLEEYPLESIQLNLKKRKCGAEATQAESTCASKDYPAVVFKFTATVKNKYEQVISQVKKQSTKEDFIANYKKPHCGKQRKTQQHLHLDKVSRLRVIDHNLNTYRYVDDHTEVEECDKYTVLDAEPIESTSETQENKEYVFDIYFLQSEIPDQYLADYDNFDVQGCFRSVTQENCSDEEYDSEDSNAEDYYTNLYPSDSEEERDDEDCDDDDKDENHYLDGYYLNRDHSDDDDDMEAQMKKLYVNECREKCFNYIVDNNIQYEDWINED